MKKICLFALFCLFCLLGCDNNSTITKSKEEIMKEKERKELVEKLIGNISFDPKKIDTRLAGKEFDLGEITVGAETFKLAIQFLKDKNIVVWWFGNGRSPNTGDPHGNYTVKDKKIIFNHAEHAEAYSKMTRELLLESTFRFYTQNGEVLTEEDKQGIREEVNQVSDEQIAALRKIYSEYKDKEPIVLTIKSENELFAEKFHYIDFHNGDENAQIVETENTTFTLVERVASP